MKHLYFHITLKALLFVIIGSLFQIGWQPTTYGQGEEKAPKIAFAAYDIFLMDPDGTNHVQIADVPAPSDHPSWSPTGSQIVFSGGKLDEDFNYLYIVDIETSEITTLTTGTQPNWSPTENVIAFISYDEEHGLGIYLINTDGTNRVFLAPLSDANNYDVISWSPDGKQIAFIRDDQIYIIDVAESLKGNNETVTLLATERDFCTAFADYFSLAWSSRNQIAVSLSCSLRLDIYLVDLNNPKYAITSAINLTGDEIEQQGFRTSDGGLDWSPDGTQLLFVAVETAIDQNQICVIDVSDTLEKWSLVFRPLTQGMLHQVYLNPTWQPILQTER